MSPSPLSPVLVSFDIDGTLETGDPRGPISIDVVRAAQARGWIVGSCSDRTLTEQRKMWLEAEITVHFVAPKQGLDSVREKFPSERFVHIGDTSVDEHYARLAGFEFVQIPPHLTCGRDGVQEGWFDAVAHIADQGDGATGRRPATDGGDR